jgi:hypothetical protein
VLDAVFLTPAHAGAGVSLAQVPVSRRRALCGRRYAWIEAI